MFSLIRLLIALCVEPILFVWLCPRLPGNNFLLAFTPLLLQACIYMPLLRPPSPAHYRSDYCYFCACSVLSQLPQRDLIISGIARFKFLLFSSCHYHNGASLPKQFSFSLLYERKKRYFFNNIDKYFHFQVVWSLNGVHISKWEPLLFCVSWVIESSSVSLRHSLCLTVLHSSFCLTHTESWHKPIGVCMVFLCCSSVGSLFRWTVFRLICEALFSNGKLMHFHLMLQQNVPFE